MSLLRIKDNERSRTVVLMLRVAVFLTFIYKCWLSAEMQYNTLGMGMGVMGKVVAYMTNGLIMFLLYFFASSIAFSSLYRSKYSPVDEAGERLFTKSGFNIIFGAAVCISNIIAGSLNFVAYFNRVAITFTLIILPLIMSVLTVVITFSAMLICVGKRNFRQLFVSMCLPMAVMLLLLR